MNGSTRLGYELLSDDEVLNLASQVDTLTPEAAEQLRSEMSRRGLSHSDAEKFCETTREIEKRTGDVTIYIPIGVGRAFLGKFDFVAGRMTEELDATLWILLFWVPVFPIATYRIRRPKGSTFTDRYTFTILKKYPRNWRQIGMTLLKFFGFVFAALFLLDVLGRLIR